MGGPDGWQIDETVARAIEIRGAVIENPKILSIQRAVLKGTRMRSWLIPPAEAGASSEGRRSVTP